MCEKRWFQHGSQHRSQHAGFLMDLSAPLALVCSNIAHSMLFSSNAVLAIALSSATLGFFTRPSTRPLPPCTCHCLGSLSVPADEARLGNNPAIGSRSYQPQVLVDASVSWLFWGVLLGLIFAFALAAGWHCFIASLRHSLDPHPLVHHGVLAP